MHDTKAGWFKSQFRSHKCLISVDKITALDFTSSIRPSAAKALQARVRANLFGDGFVDSGAASDALAIVVRNIRPPEQSKAVGQLVS